MGRFQYACGVLAAISWVCVASGGAYPDCDTAQAYHHGNGRCDEGFNNEACGYDGGDCCECTCQDSEHFECGVEGYHCLDPDASCQHGETMTFASASSLISTPTTATNDSDGFPDFSVHKRHLAAFEPTSSPTSTPTTVTDDHPSAYSMTFAPTSSPTSTPNPATDDSDSVHIYSMDDDTSASSDDGSSSEETIIIIVACVAIALVVIGSVIFILKRRGLARDASDNYHSLAEPSSLESATGGLATVEARATDDGLPSGRDTMSEAFLVANSPRGRGHR